MRQQIRLELSIWLVFVFGPWSRLGLCTCENEQDQCAKLNFDNFDCSKGQLYIPYPCGADGLVSQIKLATTNITTETLCYAADPTLYSFVHFRSRTNLPCSYVSPEQENPNPAPSRGEIRPFGSIYCTTVNIMALVEIKFWLLWITINGSPTNTKALKSQIAKAVQEVKSDAESRDLPLALVIQWCPQPVKPGTQFNRSQYIKRFGALLADIKIKTINSFVILLDPLIYSLATQTESDISLAKKTSWFYHTLLHKHKYIFTAVYVYIKNSTVAPGDMNVDLGVFFELLHRKTESFGLKVCCPELAAINLTLDYLSNLEATHLKYLYILDRLTLDFPKTKIGRIGLYSLLVVRVLDIVSLDCQSLFLQLFQNRRLALCLNSLTLFIKKTDPILSQSKSKSKDYMLRLTMNSKMNLTDFYVGVALPTNGCKSTQDKQIKKELQLIGSDSSPNTTIAITVLFALGLHWVHLTQSIRPNFSAEEEKYILEVWLKLITIEDRSLSIIKTTRCQLYFYSSLLIKWPGIELIPKTIYPDPLKNEMLSFISTLITELSLLLNKYASLQTLDCLVSLCMSNCDLAIIFLNYLLLNKPDPLNEKIILPVTTIMSLLVKLSTTLGPHHNLATMKLNGINYDRISVLADIVMSQKLSDDSTCPTPRQVRDTMSQLSCVMLT
ncbi:hypothetical protein NEHOM01_2233 [Nematocida homosporus]|uniref:uncharacterized protein n=1 Tax=Nematocida homosporus TaxID=1912981 RepID=UPI0022205DDB|nr:uncharacterized protein NEHOM01_2233 [Nematocida homosporus]KAI5187510.1 hypothetical protein NEHOM01_2233 [Nematocida homosporus]